jgi:hypothetical protein
LVLQLDDAADRGHRHALVGHGHDLLDDPYLHPGVAALAASGALGRHHAEVVDPAQEGLLDREHLGDLPHRVERNVLIV